MDIVENSESLDVRTGLPEDLRFLVERYPRGIWTRHENVAGAAAMWLERHAMFREVGALLDAGTARHREGQTDARTYAGWLAPRLSFFLQNLHGHHHVEDMHYFPVFAKAEPRLARGFGLLDADHHLIHAALEANAEAADAFLSAVREGSHADDLRRTAEAYGDAQSGLVALLRRHLDDEEDLIIPLILDRGERGLGI